MSTEANLDLVLFFKALADAERLQIAGALARASQSSAQLAAALQLKPNTVLRHLTLLMAAGLVREAQGGYHLRLDAIHARAAQLADAPAPPELPEGTPEYERAVLSAFLNADGTLKEIPAQGKKQEVFFRHILQAFEAGREYTEKEVNDIIRRMHEDTAYFRRALIDRGWLKREVDGRRYWRAA